MKKFLSVLLSVLMVTAMLPMQVFAAEENCDHIFTEEAWEMVSEEWKKVHPASGVGTSSVITIGQEPSCTEDGWDADYCIICGEFQSEKEPVSALGHDFSEVVDQPTCTLAGTAKCTRVNEKVEIVEDAGVFVPKITLTPCEETTSDPESAPIIAPTGHSFTNYVSDDNATCTEDGTETAECDNGCGETDTRTVEGSAIGHSFTYYVSDDNATCTANGTETAECDNGCGETDTRALENSALGHSYEAAVTAPTCTEDGYTTYTCTRGDDSYVVADEGTALGHDYVGLVTKPTCTERGYTTYTCSRCKDEYVADFVAPNGHTVVLIPANAATCETDGNTEGKKCAVCGAVLAEPEVIQATGHEWHKEVIQEATCANGGRSGIAEYTCAKCNESHVETEVAPEHLVDEDNLVIEEEPTCSVPGRATGTCERCGEANVKVTLPALGHDNIVEVVEPTCTAYGYTLNTCQRCGFVAKEFTSQKLGHNYTTEIIEPTCEQAGKTIYTCTRCGDMYESDNTGALGHDIIDTVVPPTCEEQGYTTHICSRGDYEDTDTYVTALGHDLGEYTVTVEPTCTENGEKQAQCSRCDYVHTQPVNMLGHAYETTVTAPTCTEDGYTTYTCTRCGYSYVEEYEGTALGHDLGEYTVTVEPTCTAYGKKEAECSRCDYVDTQQVDMIAHTDYYKVITHPTCEGTGKSALYCSVCGNYLGTEKKIPATGHNMVVDEDMPVDCMHGQVTRCTNIDENTGIPCDHTEESSVREDKITYADQVITYPNDPTAYVEGYNFDPETDVLSTSHEYEWTYIAATCEQDARYVGTCVRTRGDKKCPANEGIIYSTVTVICMNTAFGHNWSLLDDDSSKQPTCTEDGYRHYMCLNDHSHTYTEKIPATGHDYVVKDHVAATCTAPGYDVYGCSRCNDTALEYNVTTEQAKGHDYRYVAEQSKDATCGADGYRYYECAAEGCTASKTEVIPATGAHKYESKPEPATCIKEGYEVYTCSVCGASYANVTTPALGHQYIVIKKVAATCTTEGCDIYKCTRCSSSYNVTSTPALGHDYVVKDHVAATCTAPGYDVYGCSRCNDTALEYNVTTEQAKGHDYRYVAEQSKDATCGADGYRYYECAAEGCTASKTEVIPATGAHKYTRTTKPATCTTEGYEVYTCSCGATYTNVTTPAFGHHYVVVEKTPATCTTQGYDKYKCVDCEKSYTETTTDALGHDYVVKEHVAATCTEPGYDVYGCSRCNDDSLKYNVTTEQAKGHDYVVKKHVAATCTAPGYDVYGCSRCNNAALEYSVTTEQAKKHDWVEKGYVQKKDDNGNLLSDSNGKPVLDIPDCGNDGTMLYECSLCGATREEIVPATGDHQYLEIIDDQDLMYYPATCIEDGVKGYVCMVCGANQTLVVPATGHSLQYTETPATCTENGKMVAKCADCDYSETYVIPATGHIYDTNGVYTPSTCVKDGYTTYTCTVCKKASVTKTEDKAAGHVYRASVTNPATLNADGTITSACIHCGKYSAKTIPGIKSITLSTTKYVYNGKACRPAVTITDSEGNKITSANYELVYANNKKIGTASVTIKFKGNYAGTVKKSFKIVPKNVGISDISTSKAKIRFTWGKVSNCDGYQIQYSTSKTFKSKKTITIKGRKACTQVISKLKSGKKYYIRIRAYKVVNGKKIYGNWSTATKKCK